MMRFHFRAPSGTRIEQAERIVDDVEQHVRRIVPPEELELIDDNIGVPLFYNLGFVASENATDADAEVTVALKPGHHAVSGYMDRIRADVRSEFPGSLLYFEQADVISEVLNFGLPAPIDVQVVARDETQAEPIALRLERELQGIPGVRDVRLGQILDHPSLEVDVDRERAIQVGLTEHDVASSMLTSLSSSSLVSPNFWVDPKNNVNYTVVVQTPYYQVNDVPALMSTPVTGAATFQPAPPPTGYAAEAPSPPPPVTSIAPYLGGVATLRHASTRASIRHETVQPVLDVECGVQGRDLGGVAEDIEARIRGLGKLPAGVTVTLAGQPQTMFTAFGRLALGMLVAVALVYLLLVVLFQSWIDPLLIMLAVPGVAERRALDAGHHGHDAQRRVAHGRHHGDRDRGIEQHPARSLRQRRPARGRQRGRGAGRAHGGTNAAPARAHDGPRDDPRHASDGARPRRRRRAERAARARRHRRADGLDGGDVAGGAGGLCPAAQEGPHVRQARQGRRGGRRGRRARQGLPPRVPGSRRPARSGAPGESDMTTHAEHPAAHGAPEQVSPRAKGWMLAACIVLLVVAAVTMLLMRSHRHRVQAAERAALEKERDEGVRVSVTRVETTKTERTLTLPGDVHGYNQATLYAKVSGYVREVRVERGDHVTQGQVLATIESPETEKDVAAAEHDAQIAAINQVRNDRLAPSGVVSQQDRDNARAQAAVSGANLARAKDMLAYTSIRAPFDGVITARYVDPGALVPAATGSTQSALPVVDVAQVDELRVFVYAGQDAATFVHPGDAVTVWQDELPTKRIPGSVTRMASALDPRTRTMQVEIDLDNRPWNVLPGTFAHVELRIAESPMPLVPDEAVVIRDGKTMVATVKDDHVHYVPVELGYNDGVRVRVRQGLAGGETVALDTPVEVREGDRVRAVAQPAASGAASASPAPSSSSAPPH